MGDNRIGNLDKFAGLGWKVNLYFPKWKLFGFPFISSGSKKKDFSGAFCAPLSHHYFCFIF
jgi:hypothetical protein